MCVCALLMNEGRWLSDTDLQNEAGSTRVPDQNQNQHQIRMLKEEEEDVQGGSGCLRHSHHHDFTNNNGAGEEVEEDEEGDGSSKMEEEDEEMDSTSGACSPELIRDSSSLSCSPSVCEGPLSPVEIPAGVFSPHGLSRCVSESLRLLEERGDDAALPHRLHQIAESLVQEEDYERAVHFLQLERLYHERVLYNIAALQEAWENRWRCSRSFDNSLPHCNLNSEHLDKLKHICMTHRQPSWSSDTRELVHGISVNGESCGEKNTTSESPCIDKSGMLEQDEVSRSESVAACLAQQREPTQLCDSASSTPTSSLQTPPTLVMTETSSPATIREEAEKQSEGEQEREGEKEQETEWPPQETGKETESKRSGNKVEPGRGRMEAEPERDGVGADTVKSAPKTEEVMKEGGVETVPLTQVDKGAEKQEEEVEQEEEQEEEIEEAVEALELEEELQRPEDAILDDLAKRIQVEEIAPASGLVSILKRRVCEGADDASSTSKPLTKRRVRFHFPEDGLEQDEVGGDSWLLLLLLCLVTVVISVGGTALYCAFGNDHSSVCTDFSHNVDFYMGKVQRSVDDITHFFSSSSS